jgi:hypothetical protein
LKVETILKILMEEGSYKHEFYGNMMMEDSSGSGQGPVAD